MIENLFCCVQEISNWNLFSGMFKNKIEDNLWQIYSITSLKFGENPVVPLFFISKNAYSKEKNNNKIYLRENVVKYQSEEIVYS